MNGHWKSDRQSWILPLAILWRVAATNASLRMGLKRERQDMERQKYLGRTDNKPQIRRQEPWLQSYTPGTFPHDWYRARTLKNKARVLAFHGTAALIGLMLAGLLVWLVGYFVICSSFFSVSRSCHFSFWWP